MSGPTNEDRAARFHDLVGHYIREHGDAGEEETWTDILADMLHAIGPVAFEKARLRATMHHEAEAEDGDSDDLTMGRDRAEREATRLYENHYRCEDCNVEWSDVWDCQCDDECPTCGTDYTPVRSVDVTEDHAASLAYWANRHKQR